MSVCLLILNLSNLRVYRFTASIKEFISSSSKTEPEPGPSLADVLSVKSQESCLSQVAVKNIYLTQTTGGALYYLPRTRRLGG